MCLKVSTKETKTTGIFPYIIQLIAMRLSEQESLQYLSNKGYDISRAELYRLKAELRENSVSRLNLIASEGFMLNHLDTLDTLDTIENELWANYHKEENPTKRSDILMQIRDIKKTKAEFIDSTRWVLEQSVKSKRKKRLEQAV